MFMKNTVIFKNKNLKEIAKLIYIIIVFLVKPCSLYKKRNKDFLNFKQENKAVLEFSNMLINL